MTPDPCLEDSGKYLFILKITIHHEGLPLKKFVLRFFLFVESFKIVRKILPVGQKRQIFSHFLLEKYVWQNIGTF